MTEDHVLVALISQSLQAETAEQKLAARLLLDTLRNGNALDTLHARVEAIEPARAGIVAEALSAFIHRYGISDDDA